MAQPCESSALGSKIKDRLLLLFCRRSFARTEILVSGSRNDFQIPRSTTRDWKTIRNNKYHRNKHVMHIPSFHHY